MIFHKMLFINNPTGFHLFDIKFVLNKLKVMANTTESTTMNREERLFNEYIQKAEDFLKIEMYRPALKWFKEARKFGTDSEIIDRKIAGCETEIKKESRTISIIALVAVIIIAIAFIAL